MTRRQWLLASAALAGTAACSSKDNPAPAGDTAPVGPPKVDSCDAQDSYDPEDWLSDDLGPRLYLVEPQGQDIALGSPLPASGVRERVNLHKLDATTKDHLDAAYKALAADLKSPTKDKKSIGLQALIHNRYCSDPEFGVHRSDGGLFFAWHRAFLFFHERLIQATLKDPCGVDAATADNFRLPYWDPREDFGVYGETTRTGLFRHRGPTSTDVPKLTIDDCSQMDPTTFSDRVLAWHGAVHNWMCGQFQPAKFAGFDPLFYAFHAYVDFIWESSAVKGQITVDRNPGTKAIDPWYAVFFDATNATNAVATQGLQGWYKVDVNQFGDPREWGYFYSGGAMCDANSPGLEFTNVELPLSDDQLFHLVARNLQNSDNEREIATVRPFGHVHKSYPFVRAYLTREQATEYAKADQWGFWIRATYQQKPVSLRVTAKPVLVP